MENSFRIREDVTPTYRAFKFILWSVDGTKVTQMIKKNFFKDRIKIEYYPASLQLTCL